MDFSGSCSVSSHRDTVTDRVAPTAPVVLCTDVNSVVQFYQDSDHTWDVSQQCMGAALAPTVHDTWALGIVTAADMCIRPAWWTTVHEVGVKSV